MSEWTTWDYGILFLQAKAVQLSMFALLASLIFLLRKAPPIAIAICIIAIAIISRPIRRWTYAVLYSIARMA